MTRFYIGLIVPPQPQHITSKTTSGGEYRRWWVTHLSNSTNTHKTRHLPPIPPVIQTAPYLNKSSHFLRPQALRFRCSKHRLDIELGRHSITTRVPMSILPNRGPRGQISLLQMLTFSRSKPLFLKPHANLPNKRPKIHIIPYVTYMTPLKPLKLLL